MAKSSIIDPAVSSSLTVGEYGWSIETRAPGGYVLSSSDGPTEALRGAAAEVSAYVNGVPQCELRLYADGGKPAAAVGGSISPGELEYLASEINAFLDEARKGGGGGLPGGGSRGGQPAMHLTGRARGGRPVMNLFADVFGGDKLTPCSPPDRPLMPSLVKRDAATYVLQASRCYPSPARTYFTVVHPGHASTGTHT